MIDEKEQQILDNIKALLKHEESYLGEKRQNNSAQSKVLKQFSDEWQKIGDEDDITMLGQSASRYQLADKALNNTQKVAFNNVFNDIKRDNELLNLSKIIKSGNITLITNTKEVGGKSSLQPSANSSSASVGGGGSNYMQTTQNWANKGK